MPQVMDTRTSTMFVEVLSITKADALADFREVVPNTAISRALVALKEKERRWVDAEDSVSLGTIDAKTVNCTCRYRNEA
jgi:hypothetical protein